MSSSSITPNVYPLGATSAYIAFLPKIEGSLSSGSAYKATSSWKKFINQPSEQQQTESTTTVAIILAENTTIEVKPTPSIQELLNGPLFQVAGIFEIDEPGWADNHDEYIAETYL